ncbi:MAG TPA: DUF4386 domain-containing protein [Cyclobacteriaceae bacterium]|nr:DUF4386 domain-containing protein [Cyclobacteriaceae bacterium]HRJ83645.1 DUF4386 domain-containing protein [Cyclobacteriaceae bacterium]
MTPLRKTSLTAGILYLLTFVSIPTFILYGPIHELDFILGADSDTNVIIGNILELVVALAGIGTAVVLYPVLKKQNEAMSLALVSARILEAATIFAGVLFLLTVVTLHRSSVGTEALTISRTLVTMYDRMFLIGQSLMPAVDDMLLGLLLYHSRLVPRGLSIIGIIGGPVLLAGTFSVMFGLLDQREPLAGLSALFVAVFEFSLGIYLITKGFKSGTLNKS